MGKSVAKVLCWSLSLWLAGCGKYAAVAEKPEAGESIIVDLIVGVSVAEERVTIELREHEAVVYPVEGSHLAQRLAVIRSCMENRFPVYLEIEPEQRVVSEFELALQYPKVIEISDGAEQTEVAFEVSAAIHVLKKSRANYHRLLLALEQARQTDAAVLVTETSESGIIDVRAPLTD